MAKARKTVATPRTARSFDAICAMPRDNVGVGDFWMSTDSYEITIAQQKNGESPTAKISVPRAIFDAFADWYMTGKWKRPRVSRKAA
jgi:hypothetical protein